MMIKRSNRKHNWGKRERAGMSFLIVIAFFAIFGLIILTEVFMIDERSHSGVVMVRHGSNYGGRLGDSLPDYDNVKDDYDLVDESLMSETKLGFVQFRDNKLKIQDAGNGDTGRLAGVLLNSASAANPFSVIRGKLGMDGGGIGLAMGGAGGGVSAVGAAGAGLGQALAMVPWGKVLTAKDEKTLPPFPATMPPTDGSWQVVNGTRFKFFVFSAYFDRRDGAKLVRVIGATKTRGPERVWCRFWYAPTRNATTTPTMTAKPSWTVSGARNAGHYTSATVMARVKVIRENWNLKYSACFVLCPIRVPELDVPQYVSVVARLRAPPGNLLQLRNTDADPDFQRSALTAPINQASMGSLQTGNHTSKPAGINVASVQSRLKRSRSAAPPATSTARPAVAAPPPDGGIPRPNQIPDRIAICVKPFHFNYDQALYLMEYLEFYAILGVSHFTFYNHTIGPHAACVLEHYRSGDIPSNLTAQDDEIEPQAITPNEISAADGVGTAADSLFSGTGGAPATAGLGGGGYKRTVDTSQLHSHFARAYTVYNDRPGGGGGAGGGTVSTNYVKPTLDILPWNLRMRSQKEIRTEGLFAALNDCLYRSMYRYRYLALVDLDEFIVPRQADTLNELLHSLNRRFRNRNTGAYSFQNAFFYLQFADDPLISSGTDLFGEEYTRIRAALVTQRKTKRRFKLHPQKQRSKYVCKPESVVEAGNHFVWEFSPGRGSLNVPPTDAILQHYRVCEFGGNDCIKAPSVNDRTATKYVNRLVQRIQTVYNYLKKPCDLPELPDLPPPPPPPEVTKPKPNPSNEAQAGKSKETTTRTAVGGSSNSRGTLTEKVIKTHDNDKGPQEAIPEESVAPAGDPKIKSSISANNIAPSADVAPTGNKTTTTTIHSNTNNSRTLSVPTTNNTNTNNNNSNKHNQTIITNTATTNRTNSTVRSAEQKLRPANPRRSPEVQVPVNPQKKRNKYVVFELDGNGQTVARLEYD